MRNHSERACFLAKALGVPALAAEFAPQCEGFEPKCATGRSPPSTRREANRSATQLLRLALKRLISALVELSCPVISDAELSSGKIALASCLPSSTPH